MSGVRDGCTGERKSRRDREIACMLVEEIGAEKKRVTSVYGGETKGVLTETVLRERSFQEKEKSQ